MRAWAALLAIFFAGCGGERNTPPKPVAAKAAHIIHFYASPGVVPRGETVTLCYGVEDASSVRIVPEIEPIKPVPNACLHFTPKQDQTYKLIAVGADGAEVTETLTLRMGERRAAAEAGMILFFAASSLQVPRGSPVTLCYGVKGATQVRLEPGGRKLEAIEKSCFTETPKESGSYQLIAPGPGNRTDRREVKIAVQ